MTRTLVIEPSANLWGSERALLDLLAHMPSQHVAVCCPPGMPLVDELAKRDIRTLPYYVYGLHQRSKWQRVKAAIGVLRACMEFRPDVIHLNQSGSYKVAMPAAALLNVPVVAHIRIFEDAAYLARQGPTLHRLRGLIAISSAVETEIGLFKQLRGIPIHRVYDAYVPLDWALAPLPSKRAVDRLACIGRLVPIKGQDVLIRALALSKQFHGRVECLMVGDGEPHFVQELKQLASKASVDSDIHWLGFVRDVGPLLRTCSVLVCPSHREPLGRVVFEAWDAGVIPIVFAGSGGAAEVVAAANGGLLYDEQEPASRARALQDARALDAEEAGRLINNGRAWTATNCSPAMCGEAIANILAGARAS